MTKLRFGGLLGLVFATLLLAGSFDAAQAQVTATVSGRVEDATGASVGGAIVTIKSLETGATRTVTTDETGNYRVLSLAVGAQEVRAEKPGFRSAVRTGVNLVVGQEAVVNLKLDVGEVAQEVTISADSPLVDTTTASVSGLVAEREIKELPLNGRSFDNLITLNAGTINYTYKSPGTVTSSGFTFSVAGRRPLDNIFLLNGIEYTGSSQLSITPGGVSGYLLGIDAVREFNVQTGTYSAEYGKRAGAQVTVVTQSGTNQFHGSVFEFLRNSALDARTIFDINPTPGAQSSAAPFRRNQFGGSAGGPIQKDRLFLLWKLRRIPPSPGNRQHRSRSRFEGSARPGAECGDRRLYASRGTQAGNVELLPVVAASERTGNPGALDNGRRGPGAQRKRILLQQSQTVDQ